MRWFWDHYTDEGDRPDPRMSPLRAADLSGLPPARRGHMRVRPAPRRGRSICRRSRRGGRSRRAPVRSWTHPYVTTMVDQIISGAPVRAHIAEALRQFFVFQTRVQNAWDDRHLAVYCPMAGPVQRRAAPLTGRAIAWAKGPAGLDVHDGHRAALPQSPARGAGRPRAATERLAPRTEPTDAPANGP